MTEERHEAVGAAIAAAAGTVSAPAGLRERVVAPRPRRSPALVPRLAAGSAVAALVAAALLLASAGGPSIVDVAAAALNRPQRAAQEGLHVGAVRFPDYGKELGWKAIGEREDRVGGRRAVTVIYTKGALGVHYTVVAGRPLTPPDGARSVRFKGRRYDVLRDGDAAVVSWQQQGHTCILASTLVGEGALLKFASWG